MLKGCQLHWVENCGGYWPFKYFQMPTRKINEAAKAVHCFCTCPWHPTDRSGLVVAQTRSSPHRFVSWNTARRICVLPRTSAYNAVRTYPWHTTDRCGNNSPLRQHYFFILRASLKMLRADNHILFLEAAKTIRWPKSIITPPKMTKPEESCHTAPPRLQPKSLKDFFAHSPSC